METLGWILYINNWEERFNQNRFVFSSLFSDQLNLRLYSYFCDDNSHCDEGNQMEDKQKEIIGIDDSQLSGGVDINLSLAQSSATSYTISHE